MSFKPVSYMQTDSRWKSKSYAVKGENSTIGSAGCGPTCAAMVIAEFVNPSITPVETCAWSLSHGYKALNQGTYHSYLKAQGAVYGLKWEQITNSSIYGNTSHPSHRTALEAIKNGDYVIALMGKGNWTSSGHYVLWYGIDGNYVLINDPNSTKANRVKGYYPTFISQVKHYFICHKPNLSNPNYTTKYQVKSEVNVRAGAGTSYNILEKFSTGKIINVEKSVNNWARFVENGVRKYVNMSYLTNFVEFNDTNNHWARENINFLRSYDVIHGDGHNNFKPDKECTKAEMATMVYNMIKSIKDGVFYG